jgi:transposase-like protein
MTHRIDDTTISHVMETLIQNGFEELAAAVSLMLNEAMKLERSHFLNAGPFERAEGRRGYANGYKDKTVRSRLGALGLRIPQVRETVDGETFYPQALERGLRSERALTLAVAEMYVNGVSTRRVKEVTRQLCGLDVSSADVSRAAAKLDEQLEGWRTRALGQVPYLVLDARYEKVRHGGQVVSCAVLVATGVQADGRRTVLGVSVALSEAEVHWRSFLSSLVERGLHGVRHVVSDDHAGLKKALTAVLPSVPWQRCQFHLQQNAGHHVPRVSMRKEVATGIRAIFDAPSRPDADRLLKQFCDRYLKTAPRLAAWAEENIPEGLTFFSLPPAHWRRLRTSNSLERLNKEIKRRTRVATLFPNEASLLRLVTAIVSEISEEWETGKVYLNMETE